MLLFHYMSLASPECWAMLLWRHRIGLNPLRLLRVVLSVTVSCGVFLLTLPERLVLAPLLRSQFGGPEPTFEHEPGVVLILGYYRSGTTHLHNLLSCDHRFVTPRWVQALTPHGFFVSWSILKWILTPLLGNTRPQDEVAFGPLWPAEDDFAMNNWALASSLVGRLVVPSDFAHYQRWQLMEGLSEQELRRWRRAMCAFMWKVTRQARSRRLLLKSPSHSGRVAELRRLFGDRVKFIVIHRDREEVIRSHLAMSKRMSGFRLEPALDEADFRATLEDDVERTEAAMEDDLAVVAPERVARIAFRDLVRDPIAELERAYAHLGLAWTDALESRVLAYLVDEGRYTPRHSQEEHEFSHEVTGRSVRVWRGLAAGIGAGIVFGAVWVALAGMRTARMDLLALPMGLAIGLATVHAAGKGTRWLGAFALVWYLLVLAAVVLALPEVTYGWVGIHRWKATVTAFSSGKSWVWALLGLLSAWRCATRRHVRPPG
jgi:hypothetical protein